MNTLLEGLHNNYTPFKQPENSYRFALNSMISDEIGTLTNEIGNVSIETLTSSGYRIIGTIQMNNEVCIFSTNATNSEIGVLVDDTYTAYVNSTDFGFTYTNMIKGVFRIKNGCERIIYFCDGLNPDRVINLDNLDQYGTPFDVTLTKYYPEYSYPNIDSITVENSGGLLELGSYELSMAYVTDDGNASDTILHTIPVRIYDDYTTNTVDNIDGGYNLEDYTTSEGGVLPSTKRIRYDINDLDLSFPYIRFYVTATIGGDGSTKLYYREYDISIPDSGSLTYYLDKLSDLLVAAEGDVTINTTKYKTSENILLHDNRQLKFNLTENVYDYASLQQAANDIIVSYRTTSVSISDVAENYKSPIAQNTYLRDEVYALGIVYVYADCNESPVMHIPGTLPNVANYIDSDVLTTSTTLVADSTATTPNHIRDGYVSYITNFDTDTLVVGTEIDEDEVQHLGKTTGDVVQFYKVFNTAIRYTGSDTTTTTGRLAYHVSETRYPNVKDCSGNFIYPTDPDDETQTAFIRHHKMPDAFVEPFYVAGYEIIKPLSLDISNVVNPDSDNIIGYYIVRADTTDHYTVLDKGLFHTAKLITAKRDGSGTLTSLTGTDQNYILCDYPLFLNPQSGVVLRIDEYDYTDNSDQNGKWYGITNMTGPSYNTDDAQKHIVFQSNLLDTKNLYSNGGYLVNETHFTFNWNINASDPASETWVGYIGMPTSTLTTTQDGYNHKIVTGLRIPFNSRLSNSVFTSGSKNIDVYNAGQNQSTTFYELERTASNTDYDIDFRDGSDDTLLDDINSKVRYGSIKVVKDVYNNLSILKYYKCFTNISTLFDDDYNLNCLGGDSFIGKAVGRKTADAHYTVCQRITDIADPKGFQRLDLTGGTRGYWMSSGWVYYTESRINPDLRHESTDNASKTFLRGLSAEAFLEPYDYSNSADFESSYAYFYQNNFLYNDDYSIAANTKVYFPLDNKYKYCDDCAGKYETRIIYSDRSLDESKVDNYLKFRANNYVDYPNDKGAIKNSYVVGNILHTLTPRAHYVQPLSNQEMKTDSSTVFIGTGEFLSVPWQRKDFAGSNGRFGLVKTEYGNFYVDHIKRKIYNDDQPISEIDIKSWLFNNMTTTLLDKYKEVYGSNYSYTDSMLKNGVGTFVTYDPLTQRILINHKDYEAVTGFTISQTVGSNYINYISGNWSVNGVVTTVNNKTHFVNKCWTLSYYPRTGKFISFHSYNPTSWFYNDNFLYTTTDSYDIYNHNSTVNNSFYGVKYPWIIEIIQRNPTTTTLECLKYIGDVMDNNDNVVDTGLLFNKLLAYTNHQTTANRTIENKNTAYDNVDYDSTTIYEMKVENNHRIDNIRNLSNNLSVSQVTNDWITEKKAYYTNDGQGYIDVVSNPNVEDYSKSLYESDLLRDKIFHIRLIEDSSGDYSKRSLELIDAITKQSIR